MLFISVLLRTAVHSGGNPPAEHSCHPRPRDRACDGVVFAALPSQRGHTVRAVARERRRGERLPGRPGRSRTAAGQRARGRNELLREHDHSVPALDEDGRSARVAEARPPDGPTRSTSRHRPRTTPGGGTRPPNRVSGPPNSPARPALPAALRTPAPVTPSHPYRERCRLRRKPDED